MNAHDRPSRNRSSPQTRHKSKRSSHERLCQHLGCQNPGEYRAPKSHLDPRDCRWLCLEHVREHNKNWNFNAGIQEKDIEWMIRQSALWERPTWPLGSRLCMNSRYGHHRFNADFVSQNGSDRSDASFNHAKHLSKTLPLTPEQRRALDMMNLDMPLSAKDLKLRYRSLVKQYHPDQNQGNKTFEDRLKNITHAYAVLKQLLKSQGAS